MCYYVTEMARIDTIDEQLVELLQRDARQSSKVLAKQLHVSPTTIRRRIRTLIENGTIRIVAAADPGKLGLNLSAFIALNVDKNDLDSVIKGLFILKPVTDIWITTGRFDIIIRVRVASVDELSGLLRNEITNISGIRRREILIYMERIKTRETHRLKRDETALRPKL